jgi:CheY-like chemotaxis protein/anti-sigma regulatory factor (Ser/Thr protein kinase)
MRLGRFGEIGNEKYRGYVQDIHASGAHLLSLIDDLLDLSKVEAGKLELNFTSVNLGDVVDYAVRMLQEQATAARVVLRKSLPPDLPNVVADLRSMRQVMMNLLSNAIKFTDPGGQVVISAQLMAPGELKLRIKDTGIGMAPEKIGQIFNPFVQLDSGLNRNFGGSGLGLAIVKHFCDLQGGEITVNSQLGQGSEFCLRLPAATATPSPSPSPSPPVSALAPAASWEVLLVDDNRTNRTLVAEYLEEEGFTVRTAASGPAALTCLETHRVALALVDVQMPGMDGLELTHLIRTHTDSRIAAMRLVGLTALAMSGDQERCLAAGMNSYLAKPFALSTLSELLRQFQEEDLTDRQ